MKIEIKTIKTHDLKYVICDLGVRYWEDSEVNGKKDDAINPQMPLVFANDKGKKSWVIGINVETGQVKNWPQGVTANVHYKVCDEGTYTFVDSDGEIIAEVEGYVPEFLCPDDDSWGDYVIMKINADGYIQDWKFFDNEELQDFLEGI